MLEYTEQFCTSMNDTEEKPKLKPTLLHVNDVLDFLLLDNYELEMVFDVDKGLGKEPYFDYQ